MNEFETSPIASNMTREHPKTFQAAAPLLGAT